MEKSALPSPSVDELLTRWDEARQRGSTIAAEELCRDCPEQVEELRRRIEVMQSMERLLDRAHSVGTPSPLATSCSAQTDGV